MTPDPIIEVRDVWRTYRGIEPVHALREFSLDVREAESVAIVGPSGSGKSTLLHLLSGLDAPTHGSVRVAGFDLGRLTEGQLSAWRATHVGIIFQLYNLIPVLRAVENVELPLLLRPVSRAEQRERALRALRLVGLEDRAGHYPRQLSGGEQQRVAIARAIVTDPPLLFADEPTGDLDAASAERILAILSFLTHERGKTLVMVTHDIRARAAADRLVLIDKGILDPEAGRRSLNVVA